MAAYALEEWMDTPDAWRVRGDAAVAANNYADSTYFPYSAKKVREARGLAGGGLYSTPQPRDFSAMRAQQQQDSLRRRALESAKAAQDAAFAENQKNEQEILQGYRDRRQKAIESLASSTWAAMAPLNDRYDKIAADTKSKFNQTGLGGTTALPTTLLGIERERGRQLSQASATLAGQQAGLEAGLYGDELAFRERIDNQYPDYEQLMQLAGSEGLADQAGMYPIPGQYPGIAPSSGPAVSPGGPGVVLVPAGRGASQPQQAQQQQKKPKGGKRQLTDYELQQLVKGFNRAGSLRKTRENNKKAVAVRQLQDLKNKAQAIGDVAVRTGKAFGSVAKKKYNDLVESFNW